MLSSQIPTYSRVSTCYISQGNNAATEDEEEEEEGKNRGMRNRDDGEKDGVGWQVESRGEMKKRG